VDSFGENSFVAVIIQVVEVGLFGISRLISESQRLERMRPADDLLAEGIENL